jgi:hypothetical protein
MAEKRTGRRGSAIIIAAIAVLVALAGGRSVATLQGAGPAQATLAEAGTELGSDSGLEASWVEE